MITRANIIIKDEDDHLFFYKHSDGYPEGTMPTLVNFINRVKEGEIRNNVCQAAGWLIVIGHEDYKEFQPDCGVGAWRVGDYEPTTGIHGDIEYLYIIDLQKEKIVIIEDDFENSWELYQKGEYKAPSWSVTILMPRVI